MAVHQINWLLSRLPPEERTQAEAMYKENLRTLDFMGFENPKSMAGTAAMMTQSQLKGIMDPQMIDVGRLMMAKRTQNFFEKYDRKALDDYLNGKRSYESLKKAIERIKKTDERYLKENYGRRK